MYYTFIQDGHHVLLAQISEELKLVSGATLRQQDGEAKLCFHTVIPAHDDSNLLVILFQQHKSAL